MDAEQKAVFVFVVTMLKSHARQIAEIRGELAAVSAAVSGLDPMFSDVLRRKREEVDEGLASMNELQSDQYDALLRSIQN